MGRRSFGLSATQINRMISAGNAARKERERIELIRSQQGIAVERKPEYRIENFDFKEDTRVAHIQIKETSARRKIDRYVTQAGQRYPIYGDWQTKTKTIKKTIKLTNADLELLKNKDDPYIFMFRYEIIRRINRDDLIPSWYRIDQMNKYFAETKQSIDSRFEMLDAEDNAAITSCQDKIRECSIAEKEATNSRATNEFRLGKARKTLNKAKNRSHFVLFSILTFGIFAAFHSNRRIAKYEKKISGFEAAIDRNNEDIESWKKKSSDLGCEIEKYREEIIENAKKREKALAKVRQQYETDLANVHPLPMRVETNPDNIGFIPLKTLCGMNYEKIVGCYVIHNKEKDKYYVGQSKDVMKRICKQHFDGTKVKNIIFAEDYYSSQYENKADLFEVKIIPLSTKDELDRRESELIEQYDAFRRGYNGTNGNT